MAKLIGFDCRLAGTQHTGIGRYVIQLVPDLIRQAPRSYRWRLFVANKNQQTQLLKQLRPEDHARVEFQLTPVSHYSFKEQWQMARVFRQSKLDLLHVPHFNKPLFYQGKTVLTIHDLLWHKQRGNRVTTLSPLVYRLKYQLYRLVVAQAVKTAQAILVPSLVTKRDLISYYPQARTKTFVTYEGVTLSQTQHQPKKLLPSQYILFVGSLYPHKNIEIVLKAMQQLTKMNLVVVSARNAFQTRVKKLIKELKLTHRVIFFNWVDDAQLHYLYQHAKVLIQPSIHEGFGLTGVEALQAKTPIVVSDIDVFREIYQQAGNYFNPHKVDSLVGLLRQPKSNLLKPKATKQLLKRYSWSKCAQETLTVYAKVLH